MKYIKTKIPDNDLIFKDIDIDSSVKIYSLNNEKDLYGTIRWIGKNEKNEYLYGIELDDKYNNGYDGQFNGERLFCCSKGQGILSHINVVCKDSRFSIISIDKISSETSVASPGFTSVLSEGSHKGIQGSGTSDYFDCSIVALFGISDTLDFMINSLINQNEDNIITKIRQIFAWKIVYPLRKFGFVSFHRMQEIKILLANKDGKSNKCKEMDTIDAFSLLESFCPDEPLLSIQPFRNQNFTSMILRLFVNLENKIKFINSEQLINISMVQNEIMFDKLPTCLIVQLPQDFSGEKCYENIFPLNTIEISSICIDYFIKCSRCNQEAIYLCDKCIEEQNFNIINGFYCNYHQCQHENLICFPQSKIKSKSKVYMKLSAIICLNNYRFVAYLKHHERLKQWLFFDSMSEMNCFGIIPKLKSCKEVYEFLSLSYDNMKNSYSTSDRQKIITSSHLLIYESASKFCY